VLAVMILKHNSVSKPPT